MVNFVEGGLRDLSVSRSSFDWGVKVPGSENHVMYVWVDALTNYLTGLGYPKKEGNFGKYWSEGGERVHMIGKDIVRFHSVYWPAFLMSADLPLPSQCSAMASCSTAARKCRNRWAMSLTRWRLPMPLVLTS